MNRNVIPQKNCIYIGPDEGRYPLQQAKAAAVSGDTIIVLPGTYYDSDLLKDGVDWHFMAGSTVINDASDNAIRHGTTANKAIFDDGGAAITSNITGEGDFHIALGISDWDDDEAAPVAANSLRRGFIYTDHEDTRISINFKKASYDGYANEGVSLVFIGDCARVDFKGDEMVSNNATISTVIGNGPNDVNGPYDLPDIFGWVWWEKGETFIDVKTMIGGGYVLYPEGTGVSTAENLWVKVGLIEGKSSFATIYCNGAANANWKVWIEAQEIRASGTSNAAMNLQSGGKIYINALKIGSAGGSIGTLSCAGSGGSVQYWVNAQKISGNNWLIGSALNNNPVEAYIGCNHYERLNTADSPTSFIEVKGTATKAYIQGGVIKTPANVTAVDHTAGFTQLSKVRIETDLTNDADNYPVKIQGAGLVLDGCTLIAPALADSIYAGSALTAKVYGTSYTNKAKNANVTIQAGLGTLVADAAVS